MKLSHKTTVGIILGLALPLFITGIADAAFNTASKGTSGAQFLKLGAGARAFGMGEAYSAVSNDSTAIYWNPGALLNSNKSSLSLMHAALFGDISYQFLGYSTPLSYDSAFGAGVQYLSAGTIKQTDSSGLATGTDSNPADIAVAIGYATKTGGWGLGGTIKYIRSTITKTATAFAADLGLLSPKLLNNTMRLSFVAQNLGTKIKFDQKADSLPLNIKAGSSFAFSENFLAALDLNFPNDNAVYAGAGCEYNFNPDSDFQFAVRAGLNTRTQGDIKGLSGWSLGTGFVLSQVSIDYAFIPFGDLGTTHRFSLGIGFGGREPKMSHGSAATVERQ